MKNFFRRLIRFVNDPRYRIFYSPRTEDYLKVWDALVGDSMAHPFAETDFGSENRPSFATALQEVHPPLEWPDFLGNVLFIVFAVWVLARGVLSSEGVWLFLLSLVVIAVSAARLLFGLCRLAWRRWFSRDTGC
jgi:hypothetical protein